MLPITVEEDLTGSNFNFYSLSSTLPFNILGDDTERTDQIILLPTEMWWLSPEKTNKQNKTHVCLFALWTNLNALLMEQLFHLKKELTSKRWLFRPEFLTDVSQKWTRWDYYSGKELTAFEANNKIWTYKGS